MHFRIEKIEYEGSNVLLKGFACGRNPDKEMDFSLVNSDEEMQIERRKRGEVNVKFYGHDSKSKFGFQIKAPYNTLLTISDGEESKIIALNKWYLSIWNFKNAIRMNEVIRNGLDLYRAKKKGTEPYFIWYKQNKAKHAILAQQRSRKITDSSVKFSILVPLYNTPKKFLNEMIESVVRQTYGKWELCLADGSDESHIEEISKEVEKYSSKDSRIKYKKLKKNEGISGNTNESLKMATGDFIVLFDHDDLLTPDALYEFSRVIENNPNCDCIYSDEDKINGRGTRYFDPHFKPDYNIDLLCSENYICHLFAVRKTLTDKYGGFRAEYDGSQDHDFILRMTEHARETVHIPKILYHWRVHKNSTAQDLENKMYCFESGRKAVKAHYERVWPDIKVDHVEDGISLGVYHTIWKFDEYPLISIIIPNKDHIEDLDKAIRSIIEKGTWPNIEFIIVENNSEKEETFSYYEKLQQEYSYIKVIKYEGEFNYSKINNYGAKYANGEYYLLMNNDVELIEADSLKEMVGYCQRRDVGVVGCRLLYSDGTIQHAGVVIGMTGVAGHVFKGQASEGDTYFNHAMVAQDYSAVTAAVMMVKKSIYEELEGFDENFKVAFNDIDFCLRARQKGKLIVYNPYACFYHYESKSRGYETTVEKQARFEKEIGLFVNRYKDLLEKGDPYYNKNLTLLKTDYSYKNIKKEGQSGTSFTNSELNYYLDK